MQKTEQEYFWEGEFGDSYIHRNKNEILDTANVQLFAEIMNNIQFKPHTILEFGANIGNNLKAIKKIFPSCKTTGIEINKNAANILNNSDFCDISFNESMFNIIPDNVKSDITFTKGVLIHLNPNSLSEAYRIIYESTNKYIILIEYYNPTPVEVNYRGNSGKLYKRDFVSEIREKYRDLSLINYGFKYHGDNLFPHDDLTWFLLSK